MGAPYDEQGGAVYIYLGSTNGLKPEAVQVITAEDLPQSLDIGRTFGYSLSGEIIVFLVACCRRKKKDSILKFSLPSLVTLQAAWISTRTDIPTY